MKRRRRFWALALAGGLLAAVARSAEEAESAVGVFGAILADIPRQAAAERAACESMLAEGLASRMWNAEEVRAAEDWLGHVFSDGGESESLDGIRPGPGLGRRRLIPLSARPTDPTAATDPVFSWLKMRVGVLESTRAGVVGRICQTAVEKSESVWLAAKTAADLEPAVRTLQEAKAALGFKWGQLSAREGFGQFYDPPGLPFRPRGLPEDEGDLRDCWSIVASPEPLLLPDPVADPAGFAVARRHWQTLTGRFQRFLKRPAIARRFAELDDRFRAQFFELQKVLDAAILRDAPAAEFEKEFKRLQSHVVAAATPNPFAKSPAPSELRGPDSDVPPDYRRTLRNVQPGFPAGIPPGHRPETELRWNGNYAGWLEWRQAGEAGDEKRAESIRQAVLAKAREFSPRVALHLAKRLAPGPRLLPPVPAMAAESGVPENAAVAELVAALRQHSAENPEPGLNAEVSKLIEAWLKFDRGDRATNAAGRQIAPIWNLLAARAHGRALLEVRDRAARAALTTRFPELSGTAGTPLLLLLRRALEKSIASEQHDRAEKILEMEAITGAFSEADHAAWKNTLARWKQAADAPSARSAWSELLRTTTSPAAAALAAKALKRLPPKAEDSK